MGTRKVLFLVGSLALLTLMAWLKFGDVAANAAPDNPVPQVMLLKVNAELRANEVKALADWYRDKMGFEIVSAWGTPVNYALIRRDDIEFAIVKKTNRFGPVSTYVFVEGVDLLSDQLKMKGVKANGAPTLQPYGMKDFTVDDPAGNRICFGQNMKPQS